MYKQHLAAIQKQEDEINKTLNVCFTEKQSIQWDDQGNSMEASQRNKQFNGLTKVRQAIFIIKFRINHENIY